MPIVNGHQAECGCYVEGHWGQYGPDHLADQAEAFGWKPESQEDDPRYWRAVADNAESDGEDIIASSAWQDHSEAADDIETWLNDHTPYICLECGQPLTLGAIEMGGRSWMFHIPPGDGHEPRPQNYVWHWHDGEFFLSPIEELESGEWD